MLSHADLASFKIALEVQSLRPKAFWKEPIKIVAFSSFSNLLDHDLSNVTGKSSIVS